MKREVAIYYKDSEKPYEWGFPGERPFSIAGGVGLIPGQGPKIHKPLNEKTKTKTKQKQHYNKLYIYIYINERRKGVTHNSSGLNLAAKYLFQYSCCILDSHAHQQCLAIWIEDWNSLLPWGQVLDKSTYLTLPFCHRYSSKQAQVSLEYESEWHIDLTVSSFYSFIQ